MPTIARSRRARTHLVRWWVVAGLALTGCSGADSAPDPVDEAPSAVAALADALAARDLSAIPTDNAKAAGTYRRIVAGMSDFEVSVTGAVEQATDTAVRATLTWTWDLDGHDWTYRTTADLDRIDDTWTTSWTPRIVDRRLRAGEVFDVDRLSPRRGDIVGSDGPIVSYRPVIRYGLNKAEVPPAQQKRRAGQVADAVGVDVAGFQAEVKAAGPEQFVEAIVYRKTDAGSQVAGDFSEIPGALAIPDTIPLAPTREFAAPILGSVGTASEADARESKGAIAAGDVIGVSGLQQEFNTELAGDPGVRIQAYNTVSKSERTLVSFAGTPGPDLRISLNKRLQTKAESILAGVPTISALVAIKPSTGALLAIANGAANAGFNTATTGQYPPGSTFKVVSSLALLRHGWTPQTRFACPATINMGGRVFKNYSDYPSSGLGTITMTQALANSCNTFFIGSSAKLGDDDLGDAARSLGLITKHDLGFPAYFGQVPTPTSTPVKGANMIGQGMVLSSPLGMATVAASVAHGSTVVPWLVASRKDDAAPKHPITAAEAAKIQTMMRQVVLTGTGSVLADLGGNIMAKTGTAEYATSNGNGTHAWMIAIDGDLAVAVLVEDGVSGSHTAGPLMHEFLDGL